MSLIGRLAMLAALWLLAPAAQAACTLAASTPLTFTASGSYDVRAGAPTVPVTSSSAGLSCGATGLTLIGGNSARATVSSGNGFRLIGPGGDAVPYVLSADSAGTLTFTQGSSADYMDSALLGLNSGPLLPKVYGTLIAGANVAAGTYSDTVTVQWSWSVCTAVNLVGICIAKDIGNGQAVIAVSIVVGRDCRIAAPSLSFGSAALVSQFTEVTQAVAVDCTKGSSYRIAFSAGTRGTATPWRGMSDAAGHRLDYNIFRPDGTTVWDETNPLAIATPGTGATSPGQMQTYRARIDPAQATPPAGHYSDTVSVVVSF